MPKKVLIGYGIDVDAVSGWINTGDGSPANPTDVSRGIFGATVGVDRLLKLWDRYGIKTSWFIPAHTIETFPEEMARIRDRGHEIGLHGYTHEHVSNLTPSQERAVLSRSIDVLTRFNGNRKPKGWTAPAWRTSEHSIRLLEEFGIEYDHSLMHHDCQIYPTPYTIRVWTETGTSSSTSSSTSNNNTHTASSTSDSRTSTTPAWMTPMTNPGTSPTVVTVPANWHLDDWPPLSPTVGGGGKTAGFVDTHVVERLWREQFDYLYAEYDEFVFPISIHPQVSGRPQVVLMHRRLIEYFSVHDGVEFVTFAEMVERYRNGGMKGARVFGNSTDTDDDVDVGLRKRKADRHSCVDLVRPKL